MCSAPEEELSVEVADIDRVHVNDVNVLEASQSEVGENLTTKATSADDKDLRLVTQEVLHLQSASP